MKKWEEIRREENTGLTEEDIALVERKGWEKYLETVVDNIPYWEKRATLVEKAPSFMRGFVSNDDLNTDTRLFHLAIDVGAPNMRTAVQIVDDVVERLHDSANANGLSFTEYATAPIAGWPTERAVIAYHGDEKEIERIGLGEESVSDDIFGKYLVIDITTSFFVYYV